MTIKVSQYTRFLPSFIKDAVDHKNKFMRMCVMAYIPSKQHINGPYLNGPSTNPTIDECSMHAERACLRQFLGITDKFYPYRKCYSDRKKTKHEIIVVRIDRNGLIKSARPCRDCLSAIKTHGIKKCHYTTDDGSLVVENVSDMFSIHHSFVALKHYKKKYTRSWVSKKVHFIKLLINDIPSVMKEYNFEMLKKHNLNIVLPSLTYKINKNIVHIMDDVKNVLHKIRLC